MLTSGFWYIVLNLAISGPLRRPVRRSPPIASASPGSTSRTCRDSRGKIVVDEFPGGDIANRGDQHDQQAHLKGLPKLTVPPATLSR
jgi:hypothetical protein